MTTTAMQIDVEKLRELADRNKYVNWDWCTLPLLQGHVKMFLCEANPQAILALLSTLEALREENARLRESMQWQPIETAPTTGRTMIMLLGPSGFPCAAWSNTWWTAGFSVENKPKYWMPFTPPSAEVKS